METNYYFQPNGCEHCGHNPDLIHIGKSSYGWNFLLHVDPVIGLNNLDDWKKRWESGSIVDEYGGIFTPDQMLESIMGRPRNWQSSVELSDRHSYGGETWDHCLGEFS